MTARVAIRADASASIGSGHIARCRALMAGLREQGAQTCLVAARGDGTAQRLLRGVDCDVRWIDDAIDWAEDAHRTVAALGDARIDWVVVDHYRIDARWHEAVRTATHAHILAIDDLADRALAADALLDVNRDDEGGRLAYADRLLRAPRWLFGPRYALLGPAYREPLRCVPGDGRARSIGVFTGGMDPGGASSRILEACRRGASFDGPVEVVTTTANPRLSALRSACRDADAMLTVDAPDLTAFFARHDLQIGSGGGAAWERCRVGAPSIVLELADNQRCVTAWLERTGAAVVASFADAGDGRPTLGEALGSLIDAPERRRAIGARAAAVVDGRGAQRVAASLLRDWLELRAATPDDAKRLHDWRNHPDIRRISGDPLPIPVDAHMRWFARTLADPERRLWIGRLGTLDVGCIRFDRLGTDVAEVSLYLDPALIGLGLGERLLAAGEEAAAEWFGTPFDGVARIVPGNDASLRLFARAGYLGEPTRVVRRIGPAARTAVHLDRNVRSMSRSFAPAGATDPMIATRTRR